MCVLDNFWVGFFAGFAANWIFYAIGRLLPSTWVRYKVFIDNPHLDSNSAGETWYGSVIISPPKWRKFLFPPLIEYADAEVKYNRRNKWYKTKWETGDWSEAQLRLDGARRLSCPLISRLGHAADWYIADQTMEEPYRLTSTPKKITLRIKYSLDAAVAAERVFSVTKKRGSTNFKFTIK